MFFFNYVNDKNPIPDTLFHYTDINGLMGIIGSGSIWCSDSRLMNDRSEGQYARRFLYRHKKAIQERIKSDKVLFDTIFNNDYLIKPGIFSNSVNFIACFCEESNLLSQWRGYGNPQGSVSIGIDLTNIESNINNNLDGITSNSVHFGKVIYDENLQLDTIAKQFDSCVFASQGDDLSDINNLKRRIINSLNQTFLFFKHSGFKEENEWRLVINAKPLTTDIDIKFRSSQYGMTQYIEAPLKSEQDDYIKIKEITLGPSDHSLVSRTILKNFLVRNGYHNTIVSSSPIPLRW